MESKKMDELLGFIRGLYPGEDPVPLHAPRFAGNEKKYLGECVDTTFVSYVGRFVTDFEGHVKTYTGAKHAVAMVNGTSAMEMAFIAAGVMPGDEVITQPLTFAATAAAIRHVGAEPVFVDVDRETMGMSPDALRAYLAAVTMPSREGARNKATGRRIAAIVPMHTFGHPARIEDIAGVCADYGIQLIEDAAESLGSLYRERHTGLFGRAAILSFNGNKPVTTGGGGMLITDDQALAERAKHLSTTAKRPHRWEFYHDEAGYNLRMPNVNAAIGCAQMEVLPVVIANKRETASLYRDFIGSAFPRGEVAFFSEPADCRSNYWLNAILLEDRGSREEFLQRSNDSGVQTRPIWTLMTKLPPYMSCERADIRNAEWLEDRVVNIPSSVRKHERTR